MTNIEIQTTLADLVTERPTLAATFDRLGLDYCCGGQRSLAEAVREAGFDVDATLAELESVHDAPASQEWEGMAGLVDHLESTHHAYLNEALPRLDALAQKVCTVHSVRHAELARVAELVAEIRDDLEPHLVKEERVLFPMIRELADAAVAPSFHCGSLQNPISVMLREHDAVGEILAQLRAATDGYRVPDDGCASYTALYEGLAELESDTHLHVHKENNLLFPAVVAAEQALT